MVSFRPWVGPRIWELVNQYFEEMYCHCLLGSRQIIWPHFTKDSKLHTYCSEILNSDMHINQMTHIVVP